MLRVLTSLIKLLRRPSLQCKSRHKMSSQDIKRQHQMKTQKMPKLQTQMTSKMKTKMTLKLQTQKKFLMLVRANQVTQTIQITMMKKIKLKRPNNHLSRRKWKKRSNQRR